MAIIKITPEFGTALKELRKEYKVTSKDLSANINKSSSYISKLENGSIQKIEKQELDKILEFILPKEQFNIRFEEFIGKCTVIFSKEETTKQDWLQNFDTVFRKIPVPSELVDFINKLISDNHLTIPEIVSRINLNEDISNYNINFNECQKNIWFNLNTSSDKQCQVIVMEVSLEEVEKILLKSKLNSNYVTVYAILLNVFKAIHNDWSLEDCRNQTTLYLNEFKFYSIYEKNKLLSSVHSNEEVKNILSDFDKVNSDLVNAIFKHIRFYSDLNIGYTNEKLQVLKHNMDTDLSFIIGLFGIDYSKISKLDFTKKKEFIKDIKLLIDKYEDVLKIEQNFL